MKVRLLSDAEEGLTAAALWDQQRAAGLGERFLEEAVQAFIRIEKHPNRYARARYRTIREIRRYLQTRLFMKCVKWSVWHG